MYGELIGITDRTLCQEIWHEWKHRNKSTCIQLRNVFISKDTKENETIVDFKQKKEKLSITLIGFQSAFDNELGLSSRQSDGYTARQNSLAPPTTLIPDGNASKMAYSDGVTTSRKRQGLILLQKRISLERKRMFKATKNVLIFVQVFHCFWMPYYIASTVYYFVPVTVRMLRAQCITLLILCCNSMVNPFIYAVMSKAYRELFIRYILRRK